MKECHSIEELMEAIELEIIEKQIKYYALFNLQ